MIDFSSLTVVLPTLNEAKNIELLLDKLSDYYPGLKIVVVDDNSSDGTQEVVFNVTKNFVKRGVSIHLIEREGELPGLTASVLDGIKKAKTKHVMVMDADLQHPPEVLRHMYETFLTSNLDLIAGSRLPFREQQGLHRVIVTYLSTKVADFVLRAKGYKVADPMSGMFLVKADIFKDVINKKFSAFELSGYKVLFDFLKASNKKMKVANYFYDFGIRPGGKSKLKPKHAYFFFRSLFRS